MIALHDGHLRKAFDGPDYDIKSAEFDLHSPNFTAKRYTLRSTLEKFMTVITIFQKISLWQTKSFEVCKIEIEVMEDLKKKAIENKFLTRDEFVEKIGKYKADSDAVKKVKIAKNFFQSLIFKT